MAPVLTQTSPREMRPSERYPRRFLMVPFNLKLELRPFDTAPTHTRG